MEDSENTANAIHTKTSVPYGDRKYDHEQKVCSLLSHSCNLYTVF